MFENFFPHRLPSYKADTATELARLGDAVPAMSSAAIISATARRATSMW